jgi:hypothetical protein
MTTAIVGWVSDSALQLRPGERAIQNVQQKISVRLVDRQWWGEPVDRARVRDHSPAIAMSRSVRPTFVLASAQRTTRF